MKEPPERTDDQPDDDECDYASDHAAGFSVARRAETQDLGTSSALVERGAFCGQLLVVGEAGAMQFRRHPPETRARELARVRAERARVDAEPLQALALLLDTKATLRE